MNAARITAIAAATLAAGGWLGWRQLADAPTGPTATATEDSSAAVCPLATAKTAIRGWMPRSSPEADRASLHELGRRLRELPPADAVEAISGFFATGSDRQTALEFEISAGNRISGWPTLRTFLLDLLLEIDPEAAMEIGRGILTAPTSADEWAIALRNVARACPTGETREELRLKTEELIRNPAWRESPSFGYLNAFDVLVHTRAVESAPLLAEMAARKDRRDLAHAGFLALDHLVQLEPVSMLEAISGDRALHESRPEMVAQQFARADLRDPAQRDLVKSWLLDPARTPIELDAFADSYPNHNRFLSQNLLTTANKPVTGTELAAHDREVAAIIRGWEHEPGFSGILPTLDTISRRLAHFTTQSTPP